MIYFYTSKKKVKNVYKRQALNYITIVFAISTIGMAIYSVRTRNSIILCTVMLIITMVSNYFSNKINDKDVDLTKEDKELLEKLRKEKAKRKQL